MSGEPAAHDTQTGRSRPVRATAGSSRRRTIRRATLALALPALFFLAAFVGLLRWRADDLRGFLGPGGPAGEAFLQPLQERVAQVEEARLVGRPVPPAVLLVGDSIVLGMPDRLRPRLARQATVLPVATFGLRPIHFAYLVDEMLRAAPALAIVELNLVWLNPPDGAFSTSWYQRLSRFLSAARMPRLIGALRREEASLLDPWLFALEERLGILYAGEGLRAAAAARLDPRRRARRDVEPAADPMLRARHGAAWVAQAYASDFTATPNLTVLRELRRAFAEAAVPVLFVVPPVNLAELGRLGLPAPADLDERIFDLRRAIGASPEEWLDLHSLLDPGDFRDVMGHLQETGADEVAVRIAQAAEGRLAASGGR